jgi:pyruvate/2-oxoglutarate dehydrogenase complex dihydrolipoamide acyltransferase (E2) component
MSKLGMNFNFRAADYDPTQGAGSMPVGQHPVIIKEYKIEPTKNGDGGMLVLTLEVIDGPSKGVTGPHRLNLWNPSEAAARIAHSQLSAICHAVGVAELQDEITPILGRPFQVVVTTQPQNEKYTQVSKILNMQGQEPKRGEFANGGAALQGNGMPPQGFAGQPAQQAPQQAPQQAFQPPQPAPAQGSQPWAQPAPQQQQAPAPAQWAPPAAQPAAQPAAAVPAVGGWQQGATPAGGAMPWQK